MSYWAATVILNLFSTIPIIGPQLVESLWGGPVVSVVTIARIFAVHYLVPFAMLPIVAAHLALLHEGASSNPLGLSLPVAKRRIHPMYRTIDYTMLSAGLSFFALLCLGFPDVFGIPENFQVPSSLSTPPHILPE